MIVLTYRDAEVVGSHPLVPLLGNLPVALTRRIALTPLSTTAVAELVGHDRADEVVAVTGGVPFFVTELAAMGSENPGEQLPTSVAHAVLARVREAADRDGAPPGSPRRRAVPHRRRPAGPRLRPSWMTDIEPAERDAIVTLQAHSVAFRHELARAAPCSTRCRRRGVECCTGRWPTPWSRRTRTRRGSCTMPRPGATSSCSPSRHSWPRARPARCRPTARRGRATGELCRSCGSSKARIGARCSRRRRTRRTPRPTAGPRCRLPSTRSTSRRRAGNEVAAGRLHRWLSRIHWYQGRRLQSEVQAQLAVKALEPLAPSVELAWAYSNLAQLAMLAWRFDEGVLWGERSLEAGAPAGRRRSARARPHQRDLRVHHAGPHGGSSAVGGRGDGQGARPAPRGHPRHDQRRVHVDGVRPAWPAREISERAVLYAEQHEVETLRQYIVAMLGRIAALEGRWDEAEAVLREAVASGSSVPLILALTALALLQVRRGDDESGHARADLAARGGGRGTAAHRAARRGRSRAGVAGRPSRRVGSPLA